MRIRRLARLSFVEKQTLKMKKHRPQLISIFAAAILVVTALTSSCSDYKKGEYAKGSDFIACEDGFRRILEEEIEVFEYQYPEAFILPSYLNENACIDSLKAGKCRLIIVTRELTKDECQRIHQEQERNVRQQCIAVDAVAIVVNKDNPVDFITEEEVGQIMRGEISHWNQLAGTDTSAIKIVFDNEGSSTVNYMRDKFLPKGQMISQNPNAFAQKNNKDVFEMVQKNRNVLGIMSVSWLGDSLQAAGKQPMAQRVKQLENTTDTVNVEFTDKVKVLPVRATDALKPVKPYQANIFNGSYPLFRKVYAICTAPNGSLPHSFYAFLTGFIGQKIISETGILPYNVQPRVVEVSK